MSKVFFDFGMSLDEFNALMERLDNYNWKLA